jgi:hypothetical protein
VATVVLTALTSVWMGVPYAVLVLAAAAVVAVIALFWSSLRTLLGETPLASADAFAIGAPRAEEEQKRAVLRTLKDLEFERSVGKISEEDYRALVAQYRAEAKRLLRQIDERATENRRRAEEEVEERIGPLPATSEKEAQADAPDEPAPEEADEQEPSAAEATK